MVPRLGEIVILAKKLSRNPAVVILGPRQVGKTTISKALAGESDFKYYDLESPNTRAAISADIEGFLLAQKEGRIILDEVQLLPELFSVLRSVIDRDRQNGKYLLLGSADPKIIRGVSETLAGRVSYNELPPFGLNEVGVELQNRLWLRGGFPLAFLAKDSEAFLEWMNDYIRAYAERDIRLLFNINLNPQLLRRLWIMLAHVNSGLLNSADLSRSLGVAVNTVNNYLEVLEGAFLLYRLPPWYANVGKRLVKSPKIYFADTGILHAILNISSFEELLVHPIIGSSWENFVILQIKYIVKDKLELFFYRTHNGAEIDLLLVKGNTPIAAIEIKNSNNPSISRGVRTAVNDLKIAKNYVITRNQTYHTIKDFQVISLSDFLNQVLPQLLSVS